MKHPRRLFIVGLMLIMMSCLSVTAVLADNGPQFALQVVSSKTAPQNQSYYILQGQAGAVLENSIQVVNTGTAAGTVRLYAVDMITGQTGGSVFRLHEDPLETAGSWISLAADELTLAAGEGRSVPFRITIPAEARPGHHLGGIVAEAVAQTEMAGAHNAADAASFQVTMQSRSAMAVQVNLPGAMVEQIDLTGISVGGNSGHQMLALGMSNSGNVMLKPSGRLIVTNEAGQPVQDLTFSMDTFLPETAVDYPVFVENEALPAGAYQASLTLLYGTGQKSTHEFDFTVTEAQLAQVFGPRGALTAPASAAGSLAHTGNLLVGGLLAFNIVLVLLFVGFLLYRRRKQA